MIGKTAALPEPVEAFLADYRLLWLQKKQAQRAGGNRADVPRAGRSGRGLKCFVENGGKTEEKNRGRLVFTGKLCYYRDIKSPDRAFARQSA